MLSSEERRAQLDVRLAYREIDEQVHQLRY
jgi:hypothetical protein